MAETLRRNSPSLKSWTAPTPFTVAPADGRSAAPASFPSCSARRGAKSIAPCGQGCAAYPAARRCPSCWPSGAPSAIKADCRRCVGEASSPGPTPTTTRTGAWPTAASGAVADAPGETWRAVDAALRVGVRGLPGGTSLAQLLALRRGQRNLQRLPRLTEEQALAWADAHHRRTGAWPDSRSGPIADAEGETWSAVCGALHIGRRGLPGGSSLGRLLAERRGVRLPSQLPPLTLRQVRAWRRPTVAARAPGPPPRPVPSSRLPARRGRGFIRPCAKATAVCPAVERSPAC